MVIIETSVFTKLICKLLPDEDLRRLQLALMLRPEQGPLAPGGAGLRKIRWSQAGRGKRGGLRILYYWDGAADRLYMLYVYEKSKTSDLTQEQVRTLAKVIREELK